MKSTEEPRPPTQTRAGGRLQGATSSAAEVDAVLRQAAWTRPELVGQGRLPMRSPLVPYLDADAARIGRRDDSPCFYGLNGDWAFLGVKRPDEIPLDFADPALDDELWTRVEVPGNWTLQGFDKPHYTNVQMPFPGPPPRVPDDNPCGLYRRRFRLPKSFLGRRVVVHFGGAESVLHVFVNGRHVGFGKDSRLPSEFEIGDFLVPGENVLAALVVRYSDATYLEDQDHWFMAGLHREVFLYATPSAHLFDVHARAELGADGATGSLSVRTTVGFADGDPGGLRVRLHLFDERGRNRLGKNAPVGDVPRAGNPYLFRGHDVDLQAVLPRIAPWAAETPNLYTLVVTLEDAEGEVVDATRQRIGFRNVEVRDRKLFVNGRTPVLRGVNRHDHDARRGKAVTRDDMREDVLLMKRFNFNAVRTAHYPNDPFFYELCDELGLYVVDEANVETHAHLASLCHDPRYAGAFLDRGMRMCQRDKNHPSILLWSLGNESGYGASHDAMAAWIRRYDPTRPLHYEGALQWNWYADHPVTDVICPMYPEIEEIVRFARSGHGDKPLIMCEYAHAMGNSSGCLAEYWEAIDANEGLQGGFIWDWIDQGLERVHADGRIDYAYGGDFGDEPNDRNFNINGMLFPDRTPHPAMWEAKKLQQPVRITARNASGTRIRVENRQDFVDLSWLTGTWRLEVDGQVVKRGRLPRLATPPGRHEDIALAFDAKPLAPGQEAFVRVDFVARRDEAWCDAGHPVAWEQIPVRMRTKKEAARARKRRKRDEVAVEESGERLRLSTGALSLEIDPRTGAWLDLTSSDAQLVSNGPELCLFRAPTDNDGVKAWAVPESRPLGRWQRHGLDCLTATLDELESRRSPDGGVVVDSVLRLVGRDPEAIIGWSRRLTFRPDGSLHLDESVDLPETLQDPARIGLRLRLPGRFRSLAWLGRGPHECYPDRRAGAAIGRYERRVRDEYVPYVVPQEHGHHTDVRWVAFVAGEDEPGLLFASSVPFGFSASAFRLEDLYAASHTHELVPRDEVNVHLDARHRGLGTASCGPDTLPGYRIAAGRHRFGFVWKAYRPGRDDPGRLARALTRATRP